MMNIRGLDYHWIIAASEESRKESRLYHLIAAHPSDESHHFFIISGCGCAEIFGIFDIVPFYSIRFLLYV